MMLHITTIYPEQMLTNWSVMLWLSLDSSLKICVRLAPFQSFSKEADVSGKLHLFLLENQQFLIWAPQELLGSCHLGPVTC